MSKDLELKQENTIQNALLEVVQRKDIDPDRLEKFLDLQIKMEERQAKKAFQVALASFQSSCPVIVKNKKVDFQANSGKKTKYNYSSLDEIVNIIKPILSKNGLSYTFDIENIDKERSTLITTIHHSEGYEKSFSYQFFNLHDDSRMNQSQRSKSAITYAKRAGLENALGIVSTEEDDDAQRALDKPVSNDQLEDIEKLLKNTKTEKTRFLKYMKVDALEDMSFLEGKKAIHALKQKRMQNV